MMTAFLVALGLVYLTSIVVLVHGVRSAPLVEEEEDNETIGQSDNQMDRPAALSV